MPRDEDIAWKSVERLEGKKWRCRYCGKESNGQVTRVKSHLAKVKGKGIGICPQVPDDVRDLMMSLLEKEAEEGSRQSNHQSSTERLLPDTPMPRQAQSVHQDVPLTQPSLELVGPRLPMPEGVADMANFTHQLTCNQQLQGDYQFHWSSTMPSLAQNKPVASSSSQIVFQIDSALNPNETENWNPPGWTLEQPSFCGQTVIGTASACPQHQVSLHPDNMPLDNLDTTHQPDLSNHRLDEAHGNKIVSYLSLTRDASEPQELLHRSTPCETGNQEQNLRGLSSLTNDQVRGNNMSMWLLSSPGGSPRSCSSDWSTLLNSLPHVNTSDKIRMDEPHNPTAGSSIQNDSSLDVNSMKRLQDYSDNISPTDPVQHPDQLHLGCGKEYGNNICSFALRTPVDMDPSIASQHESDSHNIERTAVDMQFSEAATNAVDPSSSQGNGRSSTELQLRDLPSEAQAGVAAEESIEGNGRFSIEPHSRDMPTQAVVGEEESKEAPRRFSMEPQSCVMPSSLPPELYKYLERLQITSPGAADSSNFNQQDVIGLNSDQRSQAECQFHQCSTMLSPVQNSHGESMSCFGEEESYLLNSPYNEETQMNDQQTPAGESSSQCEQSRPVGNSNCLQDCNRHPQLQTPMDIDPSIASQHARYLTFAASVPPQRQSVPHQSTNFKTAHQNPTVSSSSWEVSPFMCHPPPPMDMVPCIPSSSQAPNNAPPSPLIPPCGIGVIGPSSSPDMNKGAPMVSHPNKCDNFEENGALKRKLEELRSKVTVIRDELEFAASLSEKKQRRKVENWLPDAEKFIVDYTEAASKGCLPPHEVNKLKRKADDLLRQGKFPKGINEARETKVIKLLEGKMMGEAFKRNATKILEYLVGNQVSRLGIYGMGGVGKTTIMGHIHNRLVEKANYVNVLWITMLKDFNTQKLQGDIWEALGLGTLQETDVRKRAAMLHHRLTERGKCTIILDDVWEHFDLKEVGIPMTTNEFKLVLTTRSIDVCLRMQCQENIRINPLSREEAESLFLEELGSEEALSLEIRAVVKSIVEECAGLPLGVITIARSMRGVTQLFSWKDFLEKLKESSMRQTYMEKKVLMKLKFSYDRLGDPDIQQCLLSCALYPEDKLISKLELIEFLIDQGLFDGLETREKQYDRGLTILTKLKNVCLLEGNRSITKMHDLIKDMALHIMGSTSMVKAGKGLTGIPHKEYWTDALEKVSLMENDIGAFPLDMSPNCPKLSTLLLNNSLRGVHVIPDSFFQELRGLEVLNLSGCGLTKLPNSISDLVKLRALLLSWCRNLRCIPPVGKLTALRKLDVRGCISLRKIKGLEKLLELRYLDLRGTCIKRLPKGTFGSLLKLQCLGARAPNGEDVTKLAALETIECYFRDVDDFNKCARLIGQRKARRYDLTVKPFESFSERGVSDYAPLFNIDRTVDIDGWIRDYALFSIMNRRVFIDGWSHAIVSVGGECPGFFIWIPQDVQKLIMRNCDGTTNLAGMDPLECLEVLEIERGKNLQVLWGGQDEEVIQIHDSPTTIPSPPFFASLSLLRISECPKLKYLFGYGSKFCLPHLRDIQIHDCEGMEGIMATVASPPPSPNPAFPGLEFICVSSCYKMKRVVESEWLPHFPALKEIAVDYCENMEEIIEGPSPNMTVEEILLESLSVESCNILGGENLLVLCGRQEGEVIDIHDSPATNPSPPLFASLELLKINGCPKLKHLFGYGSEFYLPHLREINISYCGEMEGIMATVTSPPPCPNPAFRSLEKISVEVCCKMKRVVESGWLPHFPNLREIRVFYCRNMKEIIGGTPPNMTALESLRVRDCDKMRILLTHEWLIQLRNLRSIYVARCRGMVEMISGAGQSQEGSMISEAGQSHGGSIVTPINNTSSSVSLPKLTHLFLDELPQLKSICEVSVTCDSMKDMTVDNCPELKRIPLQLRLHDDKDLPHILVEDEERWKTLTWKDHINTQITLLPFLRQVERPGCPPAIELCPFGLDLK